MKLTPPRFAKKLLDKNFAQASQRHLKLGMGLATAAVAGAVIAVAITGGQGGRGQGASGAAGTGSAAPISGTPGASSAAGSASALTIEVVKPTQRAMAERLAATGSVQPWREAIIGAEIPGLALASIQAEVGQQVKKGQLLAEYESASVRAERDQAAAAQREATAQAAEARANLERQRSLREQGMVSAAALLNAETTVASAEARAASAAARLRAADIRLAQTRIVATDDGQISSRTAALGAVSSVGQELFRLIVKGRLEWRADLTADELARVRPGMAVDIHVGQGQGQTPAGNGQATAAALVGTVRAVSPAVAANTRTGPVLVDLPATDLVRAGSFVRGEFRLKEERMLAVPATAVLLRDGFELVLLAEPATESTTESAANAAGQARIRTAKIRIVARDGDWVGIEGVDANAPVVARGGAFLAEGDRVAVAPAAQPAPAAPANPASPAVK